MLSFTQINLHKATQATMLVGRDLEGSKQNVVLMTEPHTVGNRIVGMPKGTKSVYSRVKPSELAPRAGIIASTGIKITAMENWCNRDCAVAIAKIGGRQTVICLLYTSPSPRDRQKSRMPSSA